MPLRLALALSVFSLSVLGCATVQLSGEKVERNQESIRGAEALGAREVPAARPYLESAWAQASEARRLASEGDERAPMMLARSEADAQLAQDLAREAAMHAQAVRAEDELRSVRARPSP
jgi:hypothetical protein